MSKLTVDECKRIIMQGKKQLTAAEQRIAELEANNGSRWFELFGTPERAAQTLAKISCDGFCDSCALYGAHCDCDGTAQLKWLSGDAE